MKKSKIILLVMLILVLIGTFSFAKEPKGDSKCKHVYTEATCLKKATCTKCGQEKGTYAAHKWGNSWTAKRPTCTTEGISRKKCSVCGKTTDKSISKLGHDYGAWSDLNANEHIHYCQRSGCNASEKENHSGGSWYDADGGTGAGNHYKDCSACRHKKYTSEPHNNNKKKNIESDDSKHETYCKDCGGNHYMGLESHKWDTAFGEEPSVHTCGTCKHQMQKQAWKYHFYTLTNGQELTGTSYWCNVCHFQNKLSDSTVSGLPAEEYTCSDSTIKMDEVPEFPTGKYTFSFPGKLRGTNGELITQLKVPEKWITLEGWGQKTISTHVKGNEEYAGEYNNYLVDTIEKSILSDGVKEKVIQHALQSVEYDIKITKENNGLAYNKFENWASVFRSTGIKTIKNGKTYTAKQSFSNNGTFEFVFNHGNGGWMFDGSLIFYTHGASNAQLFKKGNFEIEPPDRKIMANVYYCYRTTDNKIPKNGYQAMYKHPSVVVYYKGSIDATASVTADLNKIDATGYRYVGNKVSVGRMGATSVPNYSSGVNKSATATARVGFDYTKSVAIITFFVEPVKLYYGHVSTDYKERVQDINAPNSTNKNGLEFPDYYNEKRCVIDVKSLNKFFWPGFILQDAKTFQYAGNSNISSYNSSKTIWEKFYNANETTVYEPKKTGNRVTVTTSVPSRYTSSDVNISKNEKLNITEAAGYASDKQFYYYYNTPTLKIEHKDYDKNVMLKDNSNQDLSYLVQILNEYAMLSSLITDNVGNNGTTIHNLTVNDLESGTVKRFSYNYGNRDLVQVEIHEIDSSGKESLYGVLYHEDEYKPNGKGYKVNDYVGVFEKYYTDSLSNIVKQIGQTSETFNTNKNWRIVFKYRPVERIYISFMDLKGNKIFIDNPKYPGKLLAEITDKIDKVNGYTHNVTDLGSNGNYKALGYTEDNKAYVRDYSKAKETSNGAKITVPGQTGDRYIVIFYSTEKTVLVEYKDKKGNTIKDPTTLEVPDSGTTVNVPNINLFDVVDYKMNTNYDGNSSTTENQPSRPLTDQDTIISVPSTGNNQHIIIYYEQKEALKVEYREKGTEKTLTVPPEYETTTWLEIPETGTKVEVPVVPGYAVRYYKYDDNYNGTDTTINGPERTPGTEIPVNSNGNNQYIIIYYEKIKETSKLIIEFREDNPTGKELKDPVETEIPVNEETKITPPDIEGYEPKSWVKPDGSTSDDIENIIVVGEPDGTKKIIIIYKRNDENPGETPDEPGVITPNDNKQRVVLRANTKEVEEYDVAVAIPTSEDLYTEGDVYSYRFVTDMVETPFSEKIKVRIKQKYYTDIDTLATSEVSTDTIDIEIKYNYYDIKKADLYDLKQMTIINEALKNYNGYNYDLGTSGFYEEGKATLGVTKNIPNIYYELPTGIGTEATNRVQIRSNAGYVVEKVGDVYEITLKDIAYVRPETSEFKSIYTIEADGIVEKCTFVRVQKLAIQMKGAEDVVILTGEQYNLPKKSEALKDIKYYIPYASGRAPLYNFYRNKDLYVQEKALNKTYETKFEGDYRLIEAVRDNSTTIQKFEPKNGTKLGVEKLVVDALNIHTPIINNVTLTPETDNTNSTQLANGVTISNNVARYSNSSIILNLDKKFTITIPNAGNHVSSNGYGNRNYNVDGTKANDLAGTINADRMKRNYEDMITEDYQKKYNVETEENSYGPTFAEMKLIKFPYDVYLLNPDKGDATRQQKGAPQLLKAGEWHNLYDYIKPSVTTYTFVLPIWVKDAHDYKTANGEGIYTLVVAENCPADKLQAAMNNPASVKKNARNEKADYILGKTFDTYVSGRVYDLEVRDSDDPGYMKKVPALKCNNLPLAQAGQVKAYKLGLKLGYRFYFDLKTKGISNNTVGLKPKIYYVPATGGTATADISLFYHSKTNLYNKLTEKDLDVNMIMTQTHGTVNNAQYTSETVYAKALNPSRLFTTKNTIGRLINGLVLKNNSEKLPYDNIKEEMSVCGFADLGVDTFLASAGQSATINGNQHNIRNASGHWYGEYYLPASTLVYKGTNTTRENAIAKKDMLAGGYLIVAFEEITTGTNDTGKGYLTYSAPTTNTQWQKEQAHQSVVLPNGKNAIVPTTGTPMAIYQVGLRANNDYETEGTH